jgi:hypothetical protein
MPTPTKTKTKIPTGRAATGKKIGKRAAASNGKNRDAAEEFIASVESMHNLESLFRVKTLARVVRPMGANRLVVRLQDGEEVQTLIAGRLRFHGRAASKTDRPNCMVLNSIVLLDGGHAVSNLSKAHIVRIQTAYSDAHVATYRGFFEGSVGSDCEGFDWDYTEALAADAEARIEETTVPTGPSGPIGLDDNELLDIDDI